MNIREGNLLFQFQNNVSVSKYDDWSFYRNQFQKVTGGTKAVDIVCIDKQANTTWLIEIKDYRHPDSEKITVSHLASVVAIKVRDTLAGLAAAKANANSQMEKDFAKDALATTCFNVVLHVEMPPQNNTIKLDLANLATKLKQQIKAVDAHPKVVTQLSLKDYMCWTVTG
jgi:hypothetical protein